MVTQKYRTIESGLLNRSKIRLAMIILSYCIKTSAIIFFNFTKIFLMSKTRK